MVSIFLTAKRMALRSMAALVVVGAGCGGNPIDLPDGQVWTSAHFRYAARADDQAVCDGVLDRLEAHFAAVARLPRDRMAGRDDRLLQVPRPGRPRRPQPVFAARGRVQDSATSFRARGCCTSTSSYTSTPCSLGIHRRCSRRAWPRRCHRRDGGSWSRSGPGRRCSARRRARTACRRASPTGAAAGSSPIYCGTTTCRRSWPFTRPCLPPPVRQRSPRRFSKPTAWRWMTSGSARAPTIPTKKVFRSGSARRIR